MLYTQDEINYIHSSGTAEFNRVYTTYEGSNYIGTSDGRLQVYYAVTTVSTTTDTTDTTDTVVPEEDTVITSYFEAVLDESFQLVLQPIDPINVILFGNVFTLDTDVGALIPSEDTGYTDTYWEFEGGVTIIPQDNITL